MNSSGALQELPARQGFSVLYKGKTLLSRFDPVSQGERLAAAVPLREKTLYLCPSPLYGYGLKTLLGRLESSSAVLCVEADEELFRLSQKALNEQFGCLAQNAGEFRPISLVKAVDPESVCAFARKTWGERTFRRVEELRLSGGWQLYPQLYEEIELTLRKELALEWGNAMTLIRLGRLYSRNLIRNLALLPKSENITALDFSPSPILALGAGPSLDSLLEGLILHFGGKIPHERRFRIICADTCLPALLEREIAPDLVVVLESQHWNLGDFTGAAGRKIDAAVDLSALPASARILAGKRYFFATPWSELAFFRRLEKTGLLPETLPPLGSVGLSAVALSLRITTGPVLTGGIDFSYTLDAYHARSTPGHSALERRQNRFRSVINAQAAFREGSFITLSKTEKQVRSDPAMRNYRNLFEREFGGNERLTDLAGSGLPLGIKTVSIEEAFAILNSAETKVPQEDTRRFGRKINSPCTGMDEVERFIRQEIDNLKEMKAMLSGETPLEGVRFEALLDSADYLWAHFPECAGSARRPPLTSQSFLKRVRTEIEPFLKLLYQSLETLEIPD